MKDSLITNIKGVGPKKAELLKKLNIESFTDLWYFFPRSYQDRSKTKTISELTDGDMVNISVTVLMIVKDRYTRGKKQKLRILAEDATGRIEIIFFNSYYLSNSFTIGEAYDFFGKAAVSHGKVMMIHPDFSDITKNNTQAIMPIYPLVGGLTQKDFWKWQREALERLENNGEEYLHEDIIKKHQLCSEEYALQNIHFPKSRQKLAEARYRLVFDELLLLQLGLFYLRAGATTEREAISLSVDITAEEYISSFKYELTGAQKRVIDEISKDMQSSRPMNRLLQGDVGSGKTAIAQIALYKAATGGFQGVLMAPTEILARQHYDNLKQSYEPFGIKTAFLSGSLKSQERAQVLKDIKSGEVDIVIGTHAIIQPGVIFKNLALVITDEQHRFGVKQRMDLAYKGKNPHILVMTATPIPRTLAVILYGDLDISILDELPPGRQPIKTTVVKPPQKEQAYDFILSQIQKGRQAYVVTPLIEDSDSLDLNSAESVYIELSKRFFPYKTEILHGSMKQAEKDRIMKSFYEGEVQVLVSTVVIEVGINVPNATVMLIENCERFGLAQLHQLRGRVGRGGESSYCFLINEGKNEIAEKRATIMESTVDGFIIAEKDLELRGPGEIFGSRQHGVPQLRIADLSKHIKLLGPIKEQAKKIIDEDPKLISEKYCPIKKKLNNFFPKTGRDFLIIT
ncbi:MAG: ATP-dependent DNA helicase RecG [Eubacteriales bacterium]|nr:ATP-dependent DNA helicase RecG [Eubacteriales bacterium]MDD4390148.1 ATP-dependent DNA helicase RecG [Eubacteriales bacterium]